MEEEEVEEVEEVENGQSSGEDEVDPLDAFMNAQVMPEVDRLKQEERTGVAVKTEREGGVEEKATSLGKAKKAKRRRVTYYDSESSDLSGEEGSESEDDEEWARNVVSGKGSKLEKLVMVDHSKIDYIEFRKDFFIESPEIAKMTQEEVTAFRKELGNIKVRGKNIPRPIKHWHQCGLSSRILQVIGTLEFDKPMPIQAQALPIIMQGRDCIGIAKTGSGKTMAFVMPMLRHIKDQPGLKSGDGPIGLIMAPTRELVQQIGKDIKKFAKSIGLRIVCVYGGSGVADQIAALKRGAEIVVCTPGRMIDILAMGSGNRITNMRRVTYFVLDEADRMFDMGFEPQIKRVLNMIRPDRQTVMFSATFPKQVETLARMALTNPVEILVGGRSVVNTDIEQIVEVWPEEQRFLRLLELLGHWYEKGKVLVFVASQERCDNLFGNLLKSGYPCMSLHGGKDQNDRESTINDFKSDVCNVLIATSVAARGLDVKDLQLVVNYDVPNHHEDYVHRVGRTGRAGNKGTAVTFIAADEEKFAPDLVKALKESGKEVPYALQEMADDFKKKLKEGLVQGHGSGFGGSGFKFNEEEEQNQKAVRKQILAQHGTVVDSDSEGESKDGDSDGDEDIKVITGTSLDAAKAKEAPPAAMDAAAGKSVPPASSAPPTAGGGHQVAAESKPEKAEVDKSSSRRAALLAAAQRVARQIELEVNYVPLAGAAAAAEEGLDGGGSDALAAPGGGDGKHFSTEIEINDFPQNARWKVSHKEAVFRMQNQYDVAITNKGVYVPPGKQPFSGERKLYLLIEGPTERGVKLCKTEIKKIIKEATEKSMMSGRYNI
ncbi:DEAD-box ATP-dependent RNA helicase [Chloropicon primus]|uniref:RNA helicase n=2 Tax=Chloropicon primus TaxID=1764295 RepID=A0A5B8MSY2_9CHLO|nr:DEAD-box ATP-dependent RNA helicase [Chloropicon primus]|eukprot:QDZ22735.1 DEAD-box ATP-dependent RNA helicase [Chloropicon primus]